MIKIIKIIIVITIISWRLGAAGAAWAAIKKAGNIEVITDEPLFSDSIVWYPGLTVEKSFQVKNRGGGVKTVQIETENETETGRLAGILRVRIDRGNRGIYGASENKTLRNFFEAAGVSLGEIFPDDSGKVFSAAISMPAAAGNEYQGGRAKFDLRIGFLGESQSSVTVAGARTEGGEGSPAESRRPPAGGAGIQAGKEGGEGGEGQEGEESGKSGESGGSAVGEVRGATEEGTDWTLMGIIGGILVSGGLAGWMWWRRK